MPDWLKALENEEPLEETPTLLTPQQAEPAPVPEEMDQDAAFAWLESLAAQHSAPEEQLPSLTKESGEETAPWIIETPAEAEVSGGEALVEPEEVEKALPDWLLEATPAETVPEPVQPVEAIPDWLAGMEEQAPAEAAVGEPEALFEEPSQAPVVEPVEFEPLASQPEAEEAPQEDALAWLETLARKQGAPEEQLVTHPLKPVEEPPAWVQAEVEASLEPAETVPAEMTVEAEEPPAAITEPTTFEAEAELTQPVEMVGEPAQPTDETVPSWLVSEFTTPTMPGEFEETVPAEVQPLPMLDLNQASLSELEDLPGIGFILAQAILNYRQEHGSFSSVEELDQVPGISSDRIEELKDWVEVIPAQRRYEEAAVVPGTGDGQIFAQGQTALSLGDLPAANASFSTLVHKQVFLTEVIDALKQVLNQHPDDLFTWQTLGDAHVRNDQLQEALDAYIKAEELLS